MKTRIRITEQAAKALLLIRDFPDHELKEVEVHHSSAGWSADLPNDVLRLLVEAYWDRWSVSGAIVEACIFEAQSLGESFHRAKGELEALEPDAEEEAECLNEMMDSKTAAAD